MIANNSWTPNYPRLVALSDLKVLPHARRRMREREVSYSDLMLVLSLGEWEYADNHGIRYGFDVPGVTPRAVAIARHAGIYDVAVVMDAGTCEIITVMRLYNPEYRRRRMPTNRPASIVGIRLRSQAAARLSYRQDSARPLPPFPTSAHP